MFTRNTFLSRASTRLSRTTASPAPANSPQLPPKPRDFAAASPLASTPQLAAGCQTGWNGDRFHQGLQAAPSRMGLSGLCRHCLLRSPRPHSGIPGSLKSPVLAPKPTPWGVPGPLSPATPSLAGDRQLSREDPACRIWPRSPPHLHRVQGETAPGGFTPPPPSLAGCFSPPLLLPSSSKYAFRAIRRLFSLWNKCSLPGFEHRGGGGTHTDLMTVI